MRGNGLAESSVTLRLNVPYDASALLARYFLDRSS